MNSRPRSSTTSPDDCDKMARARFKGRLPAGVQITIFPIDPASWDAGRRTTECAVARFDANGDPVTVTAPLGLQQKPVSG